MKVALVVGVLLAAAALAWFAGEQRYDNCVNAATAEHPVVVEPAGTEVSPDDPLGIKSHPTRDVNGAARRRAIDDCSRLPW